MEEKIKKKIYFWLFIVSSIFATLLFMATLGYQDEIDSLQSKINEINNVYCANFSNITDVKEVRELAESFIISEVKNAYNIQFKEIYLVGSTCNSGWWVVAEYDKKIDEDSFLRGTNFLEINPINKELTKFVTFTCTSLRVREEDEFGVIENSCSYGWSVAEVLGENKQEASNYVNLLE